MGDPVAGQRLIWDTDLDSDCDDLAATALAFGFVALGEATIIAATVASNNIYSAPAMRALLDDAGLEDVPVGAYQGSSIGGSANSKYTRQIVSEFGENPAETRAAYADAVTVLRQALADAPDGSVKIVTGGTLTNIAALLQSTGDDVSPLSGAELVALKVESIHSMGGQFTSSTLSENNIRFDIGAANYVAANSPVPVFWAGYEVGNTVRTTIPDDGDGRHSPLETGWAASASQLVDGDRPSWDSMAMYHAVRGSGSLFSVGGSNGTLSFTSQAFTNYAADTGGQNAFLSKIAGDADIGAVLNALIADGAAAKISAVPAGDVTLTGLPAEDEVLTASNTLADADGMGEVSYQWLRDGATIEGATADAYALTQADVGRAVSVRASYTDGRGAAESRTSLATDPVVNVNDAPTGAVTVTGEAKEDGTLAASHTLADEDGMGEVGYQWLRDGAVIEGATGETYGLTPADVGQAISVRASYTDGQGTTESWTSAAMDPVVGAALPTSLTGTSASERLTATSSRDWSISGMAGDDLLTGLGGADSLSGGDGADQLTGGGGDDRIDGGLGVDTIVLSGARGDYAFMLSDGVLDVRDLRLDGPDGVDTVTAVERVQFLGGAVKPAGAIESTLSSQSLQGTDAPNVFLFDTALGLGLGADVVKNFGAGDRIVTTSRFSDPNNDGRITVNSSDRYVLPSTADADPSQTTGTIKLFSTTGKIVTSLKLVGSETHEGVTYYVYGANGDATPGLGLRFGDDVAPTLALTTNDALLKVGETAILTLRFSEPPVGLTHSDLIVDVGRLGPLTATADPRVFTVSYRPPDVADAVVSISVAAGAYADEAGNAGSGAGVTLTVAAAPDAAAAYTGTDAKNIFTAPTGADWSINGLAGDDVLRGRGGADILSGGDGADQLTGGGGDDRIDGGLGVDTIVLSGARGDYAFTLSDGVLDVRDLRLDGPDGVDTVTAVERVQFLGGAVKPAGAIEGSSSSQTLFGTAALDVFLFDTALGLGLGSDVVKNFDAGDRIVTTSRFADPNNDGRITANSSDRYILPSTADADPAQSTGTIKLFSSAGKVVTSLKLVGSETHEGVTYYVYGANGDATVSGDLGFG